MDVDTAVSWIHSRKKFTKTPSLTRIQHLLHLLGNPEQSVKAVHVAGTNGKGSVVAYLSELFKTVNYTVGTFMSPYVDNFNERISLNGEPITDTELVKLVKVVKPLVEEMDKIEDLSGMTEFDLITAMMFYYFAQKNPDIVILEVGLGGMYDPTNVVVNPLVTAITTVSYDHTNILGSDLLEISKQKAGIFKPEIPVVVGNVDNKVKEYIKNYAKTLHSPYYIYGEEYESQYLGYNAKKNAEKFNYKDEYHTYKRLLTPMLGKYQVENVAVALQIFDLVIQRESLHVSTSDIQKALNHTSLSGRMEIFQDNPLIILDGAHNVDAISQLSENLKTNYRDYRIHVLFAAIKDKLYDEMINELLTIPNIDITITTFDLHKAIPCQNYEKYEHLDNVNIVENWRKAFFDLLKKTEDDEDMIVVTGSLYFISEVRRFLINAN